MHISFVALHVYSCTYIGCMYVRACVYLCAQTYMCVCACARGILPLIGCGAFLHCELMARLHQPYKVVLAVRSIFNAVVNALVQSSASHCLFRIKIAENAGDFAVVTIVSIVLLQLYIKK